MSAGGQRGYDVSGITSMRLRDASDVTTQSKLRLSYHSFASTTGANAFGGDIANGTGRLLDFVEGIKESCSNCTGLPYQQNTASGTIWSFRNK